MKQKIFGVFIICVLAMLTSCVSDGDEEVEKIFDGDWKCQYYIDIQSKKIRVEEINTYDVGNHKYMTRMKLTEIYPSSVAFGTFEYGGSWKANDKFFYGKIDDRLVKFDANPGFYDTNAKDAFIKAIKKYLKETNYKETYFITSLSEDAIRLYSEDRDQSYDMYRE